MAVNSGERPKTPEQGVSGAQLIGQIDEIRSLAEVMGIAPDLSSVEMQLGLLTPAERKEVERHMHGDGSSTTDEAPAPAPQETQASPEKKERRPIKRRFVAYTLDADPESGVFSVHESFDEWNVRTKAYERRTGQSTGVVIPETVQARLHADSGLKTQIEGFCAAVRGDLDNPHGEKAKGMTLVFDKVEGTDEELRPKWFWYVGGQRHDGKDRRDGEGRPMTIGWKDIPSDIQELVKTDPNYRKRKEWLKWMGPRVQAVRERIISGEIAERFGAFGTSPDEDGEASEPTDIATGTDVARPERELVGDASVIASMRSELRLISDVYGTVGEPPDFSPVTTSEAFLGLPKATRDALLEEAGNDAETDTEDAPDEAPPTPVDAVRPAVVRVLSKESGVPASPEVRPVSGATKTVAAAEMPVPPAPVTAADVARDAEPLMTYLHEVFAPTMAEGEEALLDARVRDGALKVLRDTYRKQGRAADEGLLQRVLAGESAAAAVREAPKSKDVADEMADRFRKAYADALTSTKTRQGRAKAILDLIQLARSGDRMAEQAAQGVLVDVRAGRLGTEVLDAVPEAEFMDAHPELPAHRTRSEGKDVRIAVDENYGVENAVSAVVRDALSRIPVEERVPGHENFISGASSRLAQHARSGETRYFSLDASAQELLVSDIATIGETIRSVYERTRLKP